MAGLPATTRLQPCVSAESMAPMEPTKPSNSPSATSWLRRRAENVIVALIAIMFISFLLQIAFRYLLNRPLGWTDEVVVLCWVWLVLWGAAFILSDKDEIRFDIIYVLVPKGAQRTFTVISSVALVVLFVVSLPASWNYVLFMKREKSAYLGMRFDYLYSIYVIFSVACIVKHAWIAWNALRGKESPEVDALDDAERV
jgi:TRAP-type C4-dicarboxylate transport system permease small subunit